ncbi:hypothetical protein GQ464_005935 [Rhodocaloribacter litoris]|uniref:hypothetical protein n=1 Tax=Rhodocaloribacter litoris TaxID=2558931 RepID=UPI00141DD1FB|nr:hypothetical protein [Rhodocaloribacter litoris]QXD16486.1 hypothetical protein GQ464_005935 [Rhodocaloribacter litoris]
MIRLLLLAVAALLVGPRPAPAQLFSLSEQPDPNAAALYQLDFSVPDAPAFNLVAVDPSAILRPTTVRQLTSSVADLTGAGGGVTVPEVFAVEFSPGMLVGGKDLTLSAYRARPWLYRLRLSAATRRGEGEAGPSAMAFGVRASLIDEADPRTDDDLIQRVTALTTQINAIYAAAIGPPGEDDQPGVVPLTVLSADQVAQVKALNEQVRAVLAAQADRRWNREALDVAVAVRLASPDSLAKNLRTDEAAVWLTYARGLGSWGQWLVGGRGGLTRDPIEGGLDVVAATLSTRFYAGVNAYKVFLEVQAETRQGGAQDHVEEVLFNGGGEARLMGGAWIEFGGGVAYDALTRNWQVVSAFAVKLGLPAP